MPSDFGDESGEKLFDWMLSIGQEAGKEAMAQGAARMAMAFRSSAGDAAREGEKLKNRGNADDAPEWAKLNLQEFKELPQFDTIKDAIGAKLDREALAHEFFDDGGKSFLVFKVDEAPEVARCFNELAGEAGRACKRAEQRLARDQARAIPSKGKDAVEKALDEADKEPLAERVEAFKRSAEIAERAQGRAREAVDRLRGR